MPALFKKKLENGAGFGIWEIVEDEPFFRQMLDLLPEEEEELAPLKGRRRLEWLACRFLVHEMLLERGLDDRVPVLKDACGKPHLAGTPYHLSFSHSFDMVAVILAHYPTGIDIQKFVPKIGAIAHKFLREEEARVLTEPTRLEHLHIYWGAKEALYKAYGRQQLDFRQHILVEPFGFQDTGHTTGFIQKDDFSARYVIDFDRVKSHFLVYCVQEAG